MGVLRIQNETLFTSRPLVDRCLKWLEENHSAIIYKRIPERKCMAYYIEGDGIPDGNFDLLICQVVPGVLSIKIQ